MDIRKFIFEENEEDNQSRRESLEKMHKTMADAELQSLPTVDDLYRQRLFKKYLGIQLDMKQKLSGTDITPFMFTDETFATGAE